MLVRPTIQAPAGMLSLAHLDRAVAAVLAIAREHGDRAVPMIAAHDHVHPV